MKCVGSLLTSSKDNLQLENLCKHAFQSGISTGSKDFSVTHRDCRVNSRPVKGCSSPYVNLYTKMLNNYENDKKNNDSQLTSKNRSIIGDILPTASPIASLSKITSSENQTKNQNYRFSIDNEDEPASFLQRQTWAIAGATNSLFGSGTKAVNYNDIQVVTKGQVDYEEITDIKVLQAPIIDVCIIQRGDVIPEGYYRLGKTPGNKKANLNAGSGGTHIFLCIKKDLSQMQPQHPSKITTHSPITAIVVIFPDKGECIPPGFFVMRRDKHVCNLNTGTSSERVFLCYKKERGGNPITDIQVILPGKNEECPRYYNIIDKSPTGLPANLNTGTGGGRIFLCYKQSMVRLQCLANDKPCVVSPSGTQDDNGVSLTIKVSPFRQRFKSDSNLDTSTGTTKDSSMSSLNQARTASADKAQDSADDVNKKIGKLTLNLDDGNEDDTEHNGKTSPIEGENADSTMLAVDEMFAENDRQTTIIVDINEGIAELAPLMFRRSLHVILAALYIRQGTPAQTAISCLTTLLKDSDFFENDLQAIPIPGTTTMLDLTVEAVCDRFDYCIESEHDSLLNFIRILLRHSSGKLSLFILQRIFRMLSFMISYYSSKGQWMALGMAIPGDTTTGSDIMAFKVFRELISVVLAQIETPMVEVVHSLCDRLPDNYNYNGQSTAYTTSRNFAFNLIEDVIDSVEISRIAELAHLAISRQSSSTASSKFWYQVNLLSKKLFNNSNSTYPLRLGFISLCAICKLAWHSVRTTETGEPAARDLGSKLLALEALLEFCSVAGDKMKISKVMGYQIRRLVIPTLLNNVNYALQDNRVFSKILQIISALWKNWRVHIRIEFAILTEQLVIKILNASTFKIRPMFQMAVLQEVVTWFDQPHLLVEMFVNYDMDGKFVSHWNIFTHLVKSICEMARKTSLVTSAWNWKHNESAVDETGVNFKRGVISIRDVHIQALEEVGRIAKTLMDASGHAHLIIQDSTLRTRSLGTGGGWEEDRGSDAGKVDTVAPTLGVQFRRQIHQQAEEFLNNAIAIYKEKESLKKAIDYLVKNDFMTNNPQEIASFLRVYKNSFDPSSIGDYLGEGGKNESEVEYWKQIRFRYTRAVSFVELELEPALRLYLTGCGFRLPGEGQKVDRFVEVFVKAFWQDNHGTPYCPFRHSDTVHLVAYATIMLNTDLHRANADKKKRKKMTLEEFIHQLRGSDQGHNIDREYLVRIYNNILEQPIELAVEKSEEQANVPAVEHRSSISNVINTVDPIAAIGLKRPEDSASVQQERQFVKEVTRNLRDSEDLLRSLSPFTYNFQLTGIDTNISLDLVSFMFETVWYYFHAITESLLIGTSSPTSLSSKESSSPSHAASSEGGNSGVTVVTINASNKDNPVSNPKNDIYVVFAALDILCYGLNAAIFLELTAEKLSFANQLKAYIAKKIASSNGNPEKSTSILYSNTWYTHVINSSRATAMETVAEIHKLIVLLKDKIQEDSTYAITRTVAAKIEKKAKVLENNTFFVREGDLSKRNRSGRLDVYHFFLFSDHLLYTHAATITGEYKVHAQLSLSTMTVSNVDDPNDCSFYISHPTKSFIVVAESPSIKAQWVRDIDHAIQACIKRSTVDKTTGLPRKMSMIGRLEEEKVAIGKNSMFVSPEKTILGYVESTVPFDRPASSSSHQPVAERDSSICIERSGELFDLTTSNLPTPPQR